MRLLILGGTVFLGRHLTVAALTRGHRVTHFNRGLTRPDAFPDVESLRGDRRGDLEALRGRTWDAVIDTSGYTPGSVRRSAEVLSGAVGHYTFVSSISVYEDYSPKGNDETAQVGTLTAKEVAKAEEIAADSHLATPSFGRMYGPLKALCESAVEDVLSERTLCVRPGLIVGPYDSSGRFTYWVRRVAAGGDVLGPVGPEHPLRVIDARDLAAWIVEQAEVSTTGTYNAVGAPGATLGELFDVCRAESGSSAAFTWVDEAFLVAEEVIAFTELPLWLPESHHRFLAVRDDRAVAAGLRFRPLAETVRDTLAWIRSLEEVPAREKVGLAPDREVDLLARYRRKSPGSAGF